MHVSNDNDSNVEVFYVFEIFNWYNDIFTGRDQPIDEQCFSWDLNYLGFCRPPFTDYLSELGKDGFSFGDVELPEGAELGVGIQDDDFDGGVQAVVAETDNYLIDESEASCAQVKTHKKRKTRQGHYILLKLGRRKHFGLM